MITRPMIPLATMLFVPGDRPDRIGKALVSGAAAVTVDLEDAVAVSQKESARSGVVDGVRGREWFCALGVRVNAAASGLMEADLAALEEIWHSLDYLVLPMVSDADTVRHVAQACDTVDAASDTRGNGPRLILLIETAAGVLAVREIAAAHPRTYSLTFGPADLSAQLGISPTADGTELLHARSQIVLAAAAGGLAPPVDGPWLDLDDLDGLVQSAAHARRLGFAGKQVLHPKQIAPIRDIFSVSAAELAWAREVDAVFADAEARGIASIKLSDGTFVDYPVARRARAILARSA